MDTESGESFLEKKEGAKEGTEEESKSGEASEKPGLFCNVLLLCGSFIMTLFLYMSGMHFANLQFEIYGKYSTESNVCLLFIVFIALIKQTAPPRIG